MTVRIKHVIITDEVLAQMKKEGIRYGHCQNGVNGDSDIIIYEYHISRTNLSPENLEAAKKAVKQANENQYAAFEHEKHHEQNAWAHKVPLNNLPSMYEVAVLAFLDEWSAAAAGYLRLIKGEHTPAKRKQAFEEAFKNATITEYVNGQYSRHVDGLIKRAREHKKTITDFNCRNDWLEEIRLKMFIDANGKSMFDGLDSFAMGQLKTKFLSFISGDLKDMVAGKIAQNQNLIKDGTVRQTPRGRQIVQEYINKKTLESQTSQRGK